MISKNEMYIYRKIKRAKMLTEHTFRAEYTPNYYFLNSLRKRDKMLGKPRILSLFPNSFNKIKNPIDDYYHLSDFFRMIMN